MERQAVPLGLFFHFFLCFVLASASDDVGFGLRLSTGVRADVGVQPEGKHRA